MVNTGSAALAIGGPFGSDSLIFWTGPAMAPGAMTKANAKLWFDQSGDAYFGGSLSAGTLTTKAATSDTSAAAQVETAVFGSNGGTIKVTLSYSYSSTQSTPYAAGNISGYNNAKSTIPNVVNSDGEFTASGNDPGTATIDLYRSVNGGALTKVTTLTVQGNWHDMGIAPNGDDPGVINYADSAGGSLTFTDPQQVAQNRQYQAVMTSRNPEYAFAGGISQNISIICVEQ